MRRLLILAAALTLAAVPTAFAMAGPPGDSFVGSWEAIDVADDSRIWLRVGGGNHRTVYQEDGLTACLNEFGQFVGGSAAGFATVDGDTLTLTATLYCNLRGGRTVHPGFDTFEFVFTHDSNSDTLSFFEDCFHRSGAPDCP